METYCLKWNSFQTNISKSIIDLRREEDFFDVTLVTDDQQFISAHKLVLSSSSELFKNILKNSSRSYHPNPLIYLNGFCSKELNLIMEYIYHGEVRILPQDIDSFLNDAQKLKIEGLILLEEGHSSEKELKKVENEGLKRESASFVERKQEENNFTDTLNPTRDLEDNQTEAENNHEYVAEEPKPEDKISSQKKKKKESSTTAIANNLDYLNSSITSMEDVKALAGNLIEYDDNIVRCKTCGKSANYTIGNRFNMLKHVEIHIEGLSFDCPFCEKSYKTRMSLDQHRKIKHLGMRVKVEDTKVQTTYDHNEDSASTTSSHKVAGSGSVTYI